MKKVNIYLFAVIVCMMLALAGCSDKAVTLSEITEESAEAEAGPVTDTLTQEQTVAEGAGDGSDAAISENSDVPEASASIVVYICGSVVSPGVYELPEGSRICDGLEAAGGFTEGADESRINLAGYLKDGDMVFFPEVGEDIPEGAAGVSTGQDAGASAGGLVNINTASADRLCTLPGIGASKAAAIVKYREENGAFTDIRQITNVSGIGENLFNNIKELICI